jgi:hypothetical protein
MLLRPPQHQRCCTPIQLLQALPAHPSFILAAVLVPAPHYAVREVELETLGRAEAAWLHKVAHLKRGLVAQGLKFEMTQMSDRRPRNGLRSRGMRGGNGHRHYNMAVPIIKPFFHRLQVVESDLSHIRRCFSMCDRDGVTTSSRGGNSQGANWKDSRSKIRPGYSAQVFLTGECASLPEACSVPLWSRCPRCS